MDDLKDLFNPFDDLCHILNNLREKGNLPLIEKDIALSKLREIYLQVSSIPSVDGQPDQKTNDEPDKQSINTTNTDKQEPIKEPKNVKVETIFEEKPDEIIAETPQKKEEPVKTEKTLEVRAESKIEDQNTNTPQTAGATIGEKYTGQKSYRDEHFLKNKAVEDVGHKMQSRPIEDIGKAIGLNDKFLYVNELFEGDAVSYKNTIQRLNNSADFNDAFNYINSHFDWDMKKESTKKFMELVHRKFIAISK